MISPPETKLQLAILGETPDPTSALSDLSSIEWLFCKQTGAQLFEFYKNNSALSSVNLKNARFDLHNLLGIVVVGGVDALDALKSAWTSALPSLRLAFRQVPEFEPNAILRAALEIVSGDLLPQRWHAGRAALELATYRREFERLQRSFSRLEKHVSRQSLLSATEIFEYPAEAATADKSSGPSLTQYLPIDSFGFSSFSIYIGAKPETPVEPLRVSLKAIETGQTLAAWSVGPAEAPIGWVELALNYALDESALGLAIVVDWPRDTSGWALALGPPHPYREFGACTEAGRYIGAPLALRAFTRLPGVRVPATTSAIRPVDAPHALTQFVPYEAYGAVAQLLPPIEEGRTTLVSYDPNIGCITVHPRKGGVMTVGRMDVVVPKHAWRIAAQIQLANERASPTQFGLMICAPRDGSRELERLDQPNGATPGFSGWKILSPLEIKSISAPIATPLEERLSVYLVTRQAPDSSPDFGWARFSRFEFSILPAALTGEYETGALTPDLRAPSVSPEIVWSHREIETAALGMEPNAEPV